MKQLKMMQSILNWDFLLFCEKKKLFLFKAQLRFISDMINFSRQNLNRIESEKVNVCDEMKNILLRCHD